MDLSNNVVHSLSARAISSHQLALSVRRRVSASVLCVVVRLVWHGNRCPAVSMCVCAPPSLCPSRL